MDDDLNTPVALAHAAAFLKHVNELCDQAAGKGGQVSAAAHEAATRGFEVLREVLGLGGDDPAAFLERVRDRRARALGIAIEDVERAIAERAEARQQRDFARADRVRDELVARGVEIFDTPQGTTWRLVKR